MFGEMMTCITEKLYEIADTLPTILTSEEMAR